MMISVIIPVFNGADTLPRCLKALAASDYSSWECIIVDDGSTDTSPTVAQSFDARLVRCEGGPHGPAHARNRGAEVAAGDILLFVDADVAVHADTLRRVVDVFEGKPWVDATFGCYDDNPAAVAFVSQYKNLFHHFVHRQAQEEGSTFWSGCGGIRRDVFHAIGGFDEQRRSIEDIELGYRLRSAGHRIHLEKRIQVTHLKRWTLLGMIESDLFHRGIPWTRLMLESRRVPNDLNLRTSQRISAALACGMLVQAAATPFLCRRGSVTVIARSVVSIVGATGLIMVFNFRLYAFFQRKRGTRFMLSVVPLQLLYYLYSVLGLVLGVGFHVLGPQRRAAQRRVGGVHGG